MDKFIKLDCPKLCTRLVHLKKNEDYAVNRVTMVKRWTIKDPEIHARLIINGIEVTLPSLDDGTTFDLPVIREQLRNVVPFSREENELCVLEDTLFGNQLSATEYYRFFPASFLHGFVFTGDLRIRFKLEARGGGDPPEKIALEEEYVLSDHQVKDRLKAGETLESLDINNKDIRQTLDMNIQQEEQA